MIQSIIDDIKNQFSYGNMITKIIIVNFFIFLFIKLIGAFTPPQSDFYTNLISYLALSSEALTVIKRPWTLITHMFLHEGIWHFAWNMILLYWFGRITGDLAGDKKILPLYILGGLAGAFAYFIYVQMTGITGIAYGASAGVTAIIVASAFLAPDYIIRLILIGDIRLKYIATALVLIDLVMISENNNSGGRFAHIGGAVLGGYYIYALRHGRDIGSPIHSFLNLFSKAPTRQKLPPMKVVHNKKWPDQTRNSPKKSVDIQERIDQILDKINESGYDSLNAEEKDFLYKMSQKD